MTPSLRPIGGVRFEHLGGIGDLADGLELTQPTVSPHLRVLREAGFVEVRIDAQRRLYRLRTDPLRSVEELAGSPSAAGAVTAR